MLKMKPMKITKKTGVIECVNRATVETQRTKMTNAHASAPRTFALYFSLCLLRVLSYGLHAVLSPSWHECVPCVWRVRLRLEPSGRPQVHVHEHDGNACGCDDGDSRLARHAMT